MGGFSSLLGTTLGGYSLSKILSALVTLLVCLIAVRLIMKITTRLVDQMQKVNDRLQKLILTAVKTLLYVLTVIITAEALGFNTSSLTALLSVLTLGITLAAEDILGNVAGGLVILSSRPFAQGDFIEAGGVSGTVREIGLNHTKLETPDGQVVLVPNKDLSSSKIINYTVLGRRRVVRAVTASYDAPAEAVKAACMEAVSTVPNVLADPAPAVQVLNADALAFPWESLEGPWKIISNLPYNVGSPLMWDIVSRTPDLTRAVFMVQKEVAERLYAKPGTKDYGALSVWIQSYVRVEWGFVVGPGAFNPPPKVDSAVVTFIPLPRERHPADPKALSSILKLCFQLRRKQLQSILRRAGRDDTAALERLGIAPEARPETLTPEQFQQLAGIFGRSGC